MISQSFIQAVIKFAPPGLSPAKSTVISRDQGVKTHATAKSDVL